MKTKSPNSNETIYEFICDCGWHHFLNDKQVAHQGFFVACNCGAAFKPNISTEPPPTFIPKKAPVTKNEKDRVAIETLVSQGFSIRDITKSIGKQSFSTFDTVEEIIQKIIEGME